ncbi:MAG TPA: TauD/TfdA family dioxygenase [Trebonia sp.]|jgi:alpha-ketoglutarate-dependent taurine dioxygenase|nr:TauD/TfdA family dioxygenase [Trebonia sp.]
MSSSAKAALAHSRTHPPYVSLDEAARDAALRAAATIESWSADDPMTIAQLSAQVATEDALTGLGRELLEHLDRSRAVIVERTPADTARAILALFAAVAIPATAGNGSGTIHRIASSDGSPRDLSETAAEFAAHTDSTFLRNPHDLIALACVHSDGGGGESFLIDVDAVTAELGPDDAAALSEPAFPFWLNDPLYGLGRHDAAILGEHGPGTARYRRDVVAGLLAGSDRAAERHRRAVRRLDALLDDCAAQRPISLMPGQLLLFDNRRLFHGRAPLGLNTARTLLRLKGYRRQRTTYRIA